MSRRNGDGHPGYWSDSTGDHGEKVAVEVRRPWTEEDGRSKVRLRWTEDGRRRTKTLDIYVHTKDGRPHEPGRAEAKRAMIDKYLSLRQQHQDGPPREQVTLGWLFREFLLEKREEQEAGQVQERTVDAIERTLSAFERVLEADTFPRSLDLRDWNRFKRLRASGAIDSRGREVPKGKRQPVSAATVNADLMQLRTVLTKVGHYKDPEGRRYLKDNPVEGFPLLEEQDRTEKRRPIVTRDEYEALLEVSHRVTTYIGRQGGSAPERSWFRELLIVAFETGRRIGAIRHLRTDDWDPDRFDHGGLRFRQEHDKERLPTKWVPVTPTCAEAVEAQLARLRYTSDVTLREVAQGGPGDVVRIFVRRGLVPSPTPAREGEPCSPWLFPQTTDPEAPLPARRAVDWWKQAERKARLWKDRDRPANYGYHGLRALFASEALDAGYTLAQVNDLGGWKAGSTTAARIYERVNEERVSGGIQDRKPLNRPR